MSLWEELVSHFVITFGQSHENWIRSTFSWFSVERRGHPKIDKNGAVSSFNIMRYCHMEKEALKVIQP